MPVVSITGLDPLIRALNRMPVKSHAFVLRAITVNANRVKKSARAKISGHRSIPHYPASIDYEITVNTPLFISATVEAKGGQGQLGTEIEFGTSTNAGIPHMGPALWENEPRLIADIGVALGRAVA